MFGRSIRFKIILTVVATLFVGFSIVSFSAIGREKERILGEAERASRMMAVPILDTIYSDMLDERAEMVYYLIKNLRTAKGVERIEIVKEDGLRTAFSDEKTLNLVEKEYGEIRPQWKTPRIPQSRETLAALAKPEFRNAFSQLKDHPKDKDHVYYIEEENGKRLFTYVTTIDERKKCESCHGDGMGRGVLMITTSLEESYKFIENSWSYWTRMGFLMIGIVGIVLVITIRTTVIKPIEKMADAARIIARGDFTHRLEIKSRDEIGVLASALNDMDVKLKEIYSGLEEQVRERTEEIAAANQELAATNQELVATNEELQASYSQLEATSADLEASNDEIKKAMEEVNSMELLKTEFIQTVSQEIRVPLTPILGYIDLMRDECIGDLTPKQKEIVEDIHLCGRNLQMVVDEVLETASIQAGSLVPEFADVDLHSILAAVVKDIKMYSDEKSIEMETKLLQGPLWIEGDRKRLSDIFTHLLRNSVKFTPRHGKIKIETVLKDSGAEIIITDTGTGIPKDKLEKIHEALQNAGSSSSMYFKGVGLGFYLVKRLVDIHNGSIRVESGKGTGTEVAVYIPKNH